MKNKVQKLLNSTHFYKRPDLLEMECSQKRRPQTNPVFYFTVQFTLYECSSTYADLAFFIYCLVSLNREYFRRENLSKEKPRLHSSSVAADIMHSKYPCN